MYKIHRHLTFRYGTEEIAEGTAVAQTPSVRRDIRSESRASALALRYFQKENHSYWLSGEENVYGFLTENLDRFREYGAVYLSDKLSRKRIPYFTLQGSTPKEQRARLVKEFNAGGASVFLISLKSGGTGLNLTAADVVIHYDPWWNLAAQNQATDRAHRIGQRSCVQVYKLIARETIEEKILNLQDKKAALLDVISGENEGSILSMSKEELLGLLDT